MDTLRHKLLQRLPVSVVAFIMGVIEPLWVFFSHSYMKLIYAAFSTGFIVWAIFLFGLWVGREISPMLSLVVWMIELFVAVGLFNYRNQMSKIGRRKSKDNIYEFVKESGEVLSKAVSLKELSARLQLLRAFGYKFYIPENDDRCWYATLSETNWTSRMDKYEDVVEQAWVHMCNEVKSRRAQVEKEKRLSVFPDNDALDTEYDDVFHNNESREYED